jgi:hypothetical protein
MARGLSYQANYAWTHNISDAQGDAESISPLLALCSAFVQDATHSALKHTCNLSL